MLDLRLSHCEAMALTQPQGASSSLMGMKVLPPPPSSTTHQPRRPGSQATAQHLCSRVRALTGTADARTS